MKTLKELANDLDAFLQHETRFNGTRSGKDLLLLLLCEEVARLQDRVRRLEDESSCLKVDKLS